MKKDRIFITQIVRILAELNSSQNHYYVHFRVKPAIFDLLLSIVIAGYLGVLYLVLQNSSIILSVLASVVR